MSVLAGADPSGTTHYPISSSKITLEIIANETKPIDSELIKACLSSAVAEAREHDPVSLVEDVYRKTLPTAEEVQFGNHRWALLQ